ncbi:MAG: hypothetical protein ACI4XF_00395 [Oscillospiraceae bacterium]
MREHYITELIIDGKRFFTIWYSDNKDGFLCSEGRIISFDSEKTAERYAAEKGLKICGSSCIDCTPNNIHDCGKILDLWNIAADAASSVGFDHIGSGQKYNAVYEKLVMSCELPALGNIPCFPKWTAEETGRLTEIISGSEAILKKALAAQPIYNYLFAALESGYLGIDEFRDMVLKQIEVCDAPDNRLIGIAAITDPDELLREIRLYTLGECVDLVDRQWQTAVLGYYWLMYTEKRLSFMDFLRKSGDLCDGYGIGIDCEEFFYALSDVMDDPMLEKDKGFIGKFEMLCSPNAAIAREQYGEILRYLGAENINNT